MVDTLRIMVHGRDVTEERGREIGEQMAGLVTAVARAQGNDVAVRVARVDFMCDGCELRQAFDADRTGWTHDAGNDYCPACSSDG